MEKWRTDPVQGKSLLFSIVDGSIFRGEAGLRPLAKELEGILNMDVDFSKVLKGGKFDNTPQIKLLDCNK